ncbi:response regulator transcription factor [Cerasicoccus fimbriatus]|uniref:response regulator transcription factor n=1 Tax=Cerasicoccus fimbriatus TaxID=3014554 RepID=UPI0022B37DFC|nr:response regulator [Cerasicoccus sp. TK19100]
MSFKEDNAAMGIVYLVDDDESFRKSIARLLRLSEFDTRDFASVGDFLIQFSPSKRGCVLLDIRMPGPDGMELFEHLRRENIGLPVIFLTGHGDVPTAVSAIKRGAFDFLTKPVEKKRLLEAVGNALAHSESSGKVFEQRAELQKRFQQLTPTEKTILKLVVEGLPNKAIADQVGNAERTVKLHRASLSKKLGANCTADLVRFHFEAGLE